MKKKILLVFLLVFIFGCGKVSSNLSTPSGGINGMSGYTPTVGAIPSDADEVKAYNVSIDNLDNYDVYAVVTNQLVYHNRVTDIYFSGNRTNTSLNNSIGRAVKVEDEKKILDFNPYFDYDSVEFTPKDRSLNYSKSVVGYSEGDAREFNVYKMTLTSEERDKVSATLKKRKSTGGKTVNIWVEDSVWSGDTYTRNMINSTMVETLANKFIGTGSNNIYTRVTNIYGEEYYSGQSPHSELIDGTNEIDILLFNIHKDYSNGRILGYFNPTDLFVKGTGSSIYSNERAVFYLDAYSLADSDELYWDLDDFWVEATISTLAHEFTHMLVFYQHYVLRGSSMASWLNEMLAMVTEDIVSNAVDLKGPRGIEGTDLSPGFGITSAGRIPVANYYNNYPVNDYNMGSSINYAVVYSYGAYLLRTYAMGTSGLEFMRDIMWSNKNDFNAIENSLEKHGYSENFLDTLNLWGKAILLSDEVFTGDERYKYNNGSSGFRTDINGLEYKIGSINMYNYSYDPTFYGPNDSNAPSLGKGSILLYQLDTNKTGDFSMNLYLPNYVQVEFLLLDSNNEYDEKMSSKLSITELK